MSDGRPTRNFAPMPLAVLASQASMSAKLFVLAVLHHDWQGEKAWPSQERLARIMSCSQDTVQRAISECRELGWVKMQKRFAKTAVYTLEIPDMGFREFEAAISGSPLPQIAATVKAPLQKPQIAAPFAANCGTNENQEQRTRKRERKGEKQSNSEKDKDKESLSLASPKDILSQLSPAWKRRHGSDLIPIGRNLEHAAKARDIYGPDLVPSWEAYCADPGTRGFLDENKHPLAIFNAQPDKYLTSSAPAKREVERQKTKARQQEQDKAGAESDRRVHEALAAVWPTIPKAKRLTCLDEISAMSVFSHDLVKEHKKEHGLDAMPPKTYLASAILELWPDFPTGIPEPAHGPGIL